MQAVLAAASLIAALVAIAPVAAAEPQSTAPGRAGAGIVRLTQPAAVTGMPRVRLNLGFDSSPLSACATDRCDEALALEPHDGYLEWDIPALHPLPGAFTLRVGSFWSILGDEWDGYLSNDSSRGSFLHRFALPTTHTGVVVDHQTGRLSLTGGVVRGGDMLRGGGIGVVGKATYWLNDVVAVRSSALWEPAPSEAVGSSRLVSSIAAALYPTSYTTVLLGHDRGEEASSRTAPGGEWDSFAALLSRAVGSRGTASVHTQWLRDPGGVRTVSSRSHVEMGGAADYLVTPRIYTRLTATRDLARRHGIASGGGVGVSWQISYLMD